MKRRITLIALTITICITALSAQAAEVGHFNGGLLNIRDYFVPEPGLYGGLYNYFYHTGPAGSTTAMATKLPPSPSIPAVGRESRWAST